MREMGREIVANTIDEGDGRDWCSWCITVVDNVDGGGTDVVIAVVDKSEREIVNTFEK